MTLPRFSDNLVVNNVAWTLGGCLVALVLLSLATFLTLQVARRTARASRSGTLEKAAERLRGPLRSLTMVSAVCVILACCAGLALSVYSGLDLQLWVDRFGRALTTETFTTALEGLGIVLGLAVFSFWLRRTLRPALPHVEQRLLASGAFQDEKDAVQGFVGQLGPLLNIAVVYAAVRLGASWLGLPPGLRWAATTLFYVVLVIQITRTLVFVVQMSTEALDRLGRARFKISDYRPYYDGVRGLWPLARRTFEAVAWIGAVTLIVGEFEVLEGFAPFGPRIIRLIAIYFVARVVVELSRVLVAESLSRHIDPRDEVAKRRATLIFLIQSVTKYVIYFGAVVLMLAELGIDPAPFLAGAGIIGLTVGLGAQKLVNDMVSGFFMLFEGQLLTGDYVKIGEVEGIVEAVHLRVTEIRDNSGRLHTLRNGNIEHIVNFSRDYVHAVVDLGVAYDSNLDTVWAAIRDAGARLRVEFPDALMKDTFVAGVEEFGDTAVTVRTITQVHPGSHLPVARALRRHLLAACAAHGVEIPYPHLVVIQQNPPTNAPIPDEPTP
jgi:small-conductance mechanosensitive channel